MTQNERMMKLLTANDATLAKVDDILAGRDDPDAIEDIRTLTLTDAAKRLGVSRPTIYRMMKRGAIERVRLNGVDRIRLASLIAYANGQGLAKA